MRGVMHAMERTFKVFLQSVVRPVEGGGAGDHDIIQVPSRRMCCDFGDGCLQSAADAIALNRVAHGFGDGEPEPRARCLVRGARSGGAWFGFQNKRGRRTSGPAPYSQEFSALSEGGEFHEWPRRSNGSPKGLTQADRRLRPFARRRVMTFTPPAVRIRARKPWRLLRTILLG